MGGPILGSLYERSHYFESVMSAPEYACTHICLFVKTSPRGQGTKIMRTLGFSTGDYHHALGQLLRI